MTENTKSAYKEKWRRFCQWQKTPFTVAPMSDSACVCSTCGTEFRGNFCPRCGQSARVKPKMTLWKTFLLFLDVWGLGNRGMFRTLRDLILRPGYLIADYISGKRNAYFPPFKLMFLLTTLSLLVGHGWNIRHEIYTRELMEPEAIEAAAQGDEILQIFFTEVHDVLQFQISYPALWQLITMLVVGTFFFFLFRNTKQHGRLDYHEFVIAMVYMVNMVSIYMIAMRFFGVFVSMIFWANLLYVIPLKQLSGYGWGATAWRFIIASLMFFAVLFCAILGYVFYLYIKYGIN